MTIPPCGRPAVSSTMPRGLSGVSGTPTFFTNGRCHYGSYDIAALTTAVQAAKAASLASRPPAGQARGS
jgi:hypothetical protein